MVLLVNFSLYGDNKESTKKVSKEPEIVGIVDFVIGKALIKKAGSNIWEPLKLKTKLTKDDTIKTFAKARVKIKFKNKKIAEITPKKKIQISELLKKIKNKKSEEKNYGVTGVAGVRGSDKSKDKEKDLKWEE